MKKTIIIYTIIYYLAWCFIAGRFDLFNINQSLKTAFVFLYLPFFAFVFIIKDINKND
jgi:hypothetical protein